MVEVSEKFLAELAKSNASILNDQPLKEGDYNVSFELEGFKYVFSQKDGYWRWSYNAI